MNYAAVTQMAARQHTYQAQIGRKHTQIGGLFLLSLSREAPLFFFFFKWHLQAILPSSSWSSLSSSFCSFYSTVAPPHPMGCCSSKIQNNPLCVANHWGLVVVVTSVKVPRNNSGGFVGDLLLLCCCSLCFLLNGKVDNQVQMLFVKALLPIVCVCVCVLSVCA